MIAILDKMLLLTLTLFTFLSVSLPLIIKLVLMCFYNQSSEEKQIYEDIVKIKNEQRQISMQQDFVTYAKLQRKLIKLNDERRVLSEERVTKKLKYKLILSYSLQIISYVVIFVIALYFRYTPICVLDQSIFPFNTLFSYPIDIPNAVSPHAWIILCKISFTSLIKPFES